MLLKTKKFEDDSPHVNMCKFLLYELWPIWSLAIVEGRRWIEHGSSHYACNHLYKLFFPQLCLHMYHSQSPKSNDIEMPRQRMGWGSRTSLNLCKLPSSTLPTHM